MKTIEIDDDLYRFIAAQTQHIGESASQILRRLLMEQAPPPDTDTFDSTPQQSDVEHRGTVGIFAAIEASGVNQLKSRVERFLGILSQLAQARSDNFDRVLELRGRNRRYFATDKSELLSSGSSTNPKAVPGTGFWVVTNNNTKKKAQMLAEVARRLDYSPQDAKRLALVLAPELEHSLIVD